MPSATSDNGSGLSTPPPSSSATVPPSEVDLVAKLDLMLAEVKLNLELAASMRRQMDLIEALLASHRR